MSGEEPVQGQPRHGQPWVGTTLYWERTMVSSSHGLGHPEIPYPWLGNVQNVDQTAAKTNPSTWNGYGAGIYDQRLSLPGRVVGTKVLGHGREKPRHGPLYQRVPIHGSRCTEPRQSRGCASTLYWESDFTMSGCIERQCASVYSDIRSQHTDWLT